MQTSPCSALAVLSPLSVQVYCQVSGQALPETPTVDVSSRDFYGVGYDDSDKRIPDMTLIHKQLGEQWTWMPDISNPPVIARTIFSYTHSWVSNGPRFHSNPAVCVRECNTVLDATHQQRSSYHKKRSFYARP